MALQSRILELLAAGGLRMTPVGDSADSQARPKYSGLADPAGVEELGRELAEPLRQARPGRVLIGEDTDDIQLGHVLARELGCTLVRAVDADGLLELDGDLGAGDRVAIVADAFRDERFLAALILLVAQRQAGTVALGALLGTPALRAARPGGEVHTVALVEVQGGGTDSQATR